MSENTLNKGTRILLSWFFQLLSMTLNERIQILDLKAMISLKILESIILENSSKILF